MAEERELQIVDVVVRYCSEREPKG